MHFGNTQSSLSLSHAHTHTHTNAHSIAHTHTHIFTFNRTHTHTLNCTHSNTQSHTHTHTHAHTNSNRLIHIYHLLLANWFLLTDVDGYKSNKISTYFNVIRVIISIQNLFFCFGIFITVWLQLSKRLLHQKFKHISLTFRSLIITDYHLPCVFQIAVRFWSA